MLTSVVKKSKTGDWSKTMKSNASKVVKARIADLNVLLHCKTKFMVRRTEKYLYDFSGVPDAEIDISEEMLVQYCEKYALMNRASAEYMLSGAAFYNQLYRKYNGLMLHASAIEMDGKGYLFSANSGTGKSTHAALWAQCFGERVHYINDDKPALRKMRDGWHVYGTPWSGKTDLNSNISAPIQAIAFLHRSEENCIARMEIGGILPKLLEQTIRPKNETGADFYFALVESLVEQVPIYEIGCNMHPEAAKMAYEIMKS